MRLVEQERVEDWSFIKAHDVSSHSKLNTVINRMVALGLKYPSEAP